MVACNSCKGSLPRIKYTNKIYINIYDMYMIYIEIELEYDRIMPGINYNNKLNDDKQCFPSPARRRA